MWRGTFTLWFSDAFSVQPLSSSSRGRRKFHHFRTNHCDPGEERKWRSAYVTSVGVSTKSLKKKLWFGGSVGGFFDGWILTRQPTGFCTSACSSGGPALLRVTARVHKTVGNRSSLIGYRLNRSGPVPVWAGIKPVQIQNLNLNLKKMKNSQKISKNISRCDESNGVKFSQKFVHLV